MCCASSNVAMPELLAYKIHHWSHKEKFCSKVLLQHVGANNPMLLQEQQLVTPLGHSYGSVAWELLTTPLYHSPWNHTSMVAHKEHCAQPELYHSYKLKSHSYTFKAWTNSPSSKFSWNNHCIPVGYDLSCQKKGIYHGNWVSPYTDVHVTNDFPGIRN